MAQRPDFKSSAELNGSAESAFVISVPHIIHQSWRSKKLENFQLSWQQSWLHNHPHWTYMFWTDKENRKLVERDFPWFLPTYDNFPKNIQRADCARYLYMLRFGGCYFDLDFESLKNLEPLLQGVQAALSYMSTDTVSDISIPNAFLASSPGHPFWWCVLQHVYQAIADDHIDNTDVHRTTGPILLKTAVANYLLTSPTQKLTIFQPELVIGVDFNWREDQNKQEVFSVCHAASLSTFNSTKCKAMFPNSYAITYWSGDITWMAP